MIKIKLRKNLLYLLIYYAAAFVDYNVLGFWIFVLYRFNHIYICIFLFPLENIIGGLIVYLYQKYSIKKIDKTKYFGIKLIHNKKNIARDGKFKKILLIFFAAFFNYFNFIVSIFFNAKNELWLMELRLSSVQIISSTLISIFAFGFKIRKHHKFSLIIMSIFFCLLISIDMIFTVHHNKKYLRELIFQYFITLYYYIGYSFNNCIEKYLVDYNYMNPFIILMLEGVFELVLSLLSLIKINIYDVFDKLKVKITGNLVLFIFLFTLYIILQIIVNIYRIYCNVIYSPMARSLIDYLMNPFVNIFFFVVFRDFYKNIAYFIIIEIICIVMSFFGCVFNEYIILYCCGLEYETQDEIADRANNQFLNELNDIDETSSNNENPENGDNIEESKTIVSLGGYGLGI